MRLVFVHGWGFEPSFWDAAAALSPTPQMRVDLGFFHARPASFAFGPNDILIGHSLGFLWGLAHCENLRGWIAINSFASFLNADARASCATPTELRAMRRGLKLDAPKILCDFHTRIGSSFVGSAYPRADALSEALAFLATRDASENPVLRQAPGRILAALNDPLTPKEATEHLADKARNADLLWSASGGHLLPTLRPEWCARAIQEFISERF